MWDDILVYLLFIFFLVPGTASFGLDLDLGSEYGLKWGLMRVQLDGLKDMKVNPQYKNQKEQKITYTTSNRSCAL